MATMASTSHGLSVWANSCVKNPINPKTGLSATLPDRNSITVRFDDALREVQTSKSSPRRPDNVNDKLQAATEEEFYDKLQQLKDENKKTLEAYERLYKEKMLLEGIRMSQSYEFQHDQSGVDREVDSGTTGLMVNGVGKNTASDIPEPVAKKPPPGKPRSSASDAPVLSKTLPQTSLRSSRKERPSSAPTERKSRSLDREDWKRACRGSNEFDDDLNFVIPMNDNVSEYEKALAKVDRLWEDFKISEYTQRRHSISTPRRKNQSKPENEKSKTSEWRHRITIPEPFNMSIREALKEKKRTTAQEELELKRLEKQREEEAECAKKFKAQPVPSHVYLPKYEEIMEKNETRRQYVKQYCQELLQSQMKPFNFEIREQEKKLQRAQSAPVKKPEKPKNGFKAKPVPKHIFKPDVDEKFEEEEELRKIRIKMRSRELLREASLPPNMAAREKLKEQEKKEKARMARIAAKKQRPRNSHSIPNYDALYREFQKELARRKAVKEGTVIEPFELETDRIRSTRERIRREEEEERRLRDNRWPYQSTKTTPRSSMKYLGVLSNSLDAIPTHSTRSADLRNTAVKKEKERLTTRQRDEEEAERRRKLREAKLRRYLSEKTNSDEIPKPRDSIAERLKRIKKEDKERMEAYQRDLEEMKSRVEQQPLLVEKFMAENARKEAEKKFATTVRSAGLNDQEFVSARSSRLPYSGRSDDYHSDQDDYGHEDSPQHSGNGDLTYTKSGSGDED